MDSGAAPGAPDATRLGRLETGMGGGPSELEGTSMVGAEAGALGFEGATRLRGLRSSGMKTPSLPTGSLLTVSPTTFLLSPPAEKSNVVDVLNVRRRGGLPLTDADGGRRKTKGWTGAATGAVTGGWVWLLTGPGVELTFGGWTGGTTGGERGRKTGRTTGGVLSWTSSRAGRS